MQSPYSYNNTSYIMQSQHPHNLQNVNLDTHKKQKSGDYSRDANNINLSYSQIQHGYAMYPTSLNSANTPVGQSYLDLDPSSNASTAASKHLNTLNHHTNMPTNQWSNYQLSYPLDLNTNNGPNDIISPDIIYPSRTSHTPSGSINSHSQVNAGLSTNQYFGNISNHYTNNSSLSNLSLNTNNTSPSVSPVSDASKFTYNHFMQPNHSANPSLNISSSLNTNQSSFPSIPYSLSLPIPSIGSGLDLNSLPLNGTDNDYSGSHSMNMGIHKSESHLGALSSSINDNSDGSHSPETGIKTRRLNGSTTKPKGNVTYPCDTCGKIFYRPYNLRSHMKSHTTEKPFACKYCGKAFTRSHDRRRHERLHEEEKKFACGGFLKDGVTRWGCNRKFARADALGRHYRTESGWLCIRPSILEAKQLERKNREEYKDPQRQDGLRLDNEMESDQSVVETIARQTANSLTTEEINALLSKSL